MGSQTDGHKWACTHSTQRKKKHSPNQTLDSDLKLPELQGDELLLFETVSFVVSGYNILRELIHTDFIKDSLLIEIAEESILT